MSKKKMNLIFFDMGLKKKEGVGGWGWFISEH